MTTAKEKPVSKGLSFPSKGSAGAELRAMMLEETARPVGSTPLRQDESTPVAIETPFLPSTPLLNPEPAALQVTQVTGNTATQEHENAGMHVISNTATQVFSNTALHNSRNTETLVADEHVSVLQTAPMRAALIHALQQPLPPLPEKGKPRLQTTSIKIRPEVWERIKVAGSLTGKNQQELVDEALRDLFAKILREEN